MVRVIAYLHLPIAACDYKLDRIQSNFVKMKQEPLGYNITSDKLQFVRNTLRIMWRFLQENFDDFRRKILTIFLRIVDYVLQKNFVILAGKFIAFWKKIKCFLRKNVTIFVGRVHNLSSKIWQFLYKNLTIIARKFDVFYKKFCQVLQENLKIFVEKFWQFLYGKVINFTK